jgi:hypothetical protein
MYMPRITAYLSNFDQEIERCHPLAGTQSCFSSEIVKIRDESFHEISKASVALLGIYDDGVFSDVVDV